MDKETSLSVAHLNKLFLEIKQNAPPIGSSQHANELYEQKIYNLLPLFCKMFTSNGSSTTQFDIFEKFCDPTSFAQMASRLMVTEIRRRASNKTTENASMAIVEFLEISPTVNTSADKKGWILLSTLNILVSFNSTHLISVMTSNSLASTLVKCLYLFFDLPPCCDTPNEQSSDYLTNTERRQLLQKVFSQLLTRLCASPSALADLTKKDDLSLLFNAITSWCPAHNSIWRKTASDVIITMAKHSNINVEYLHSKSCVNLFVENIQRIVELGSTSSRDIILMFRTFVQFLTEYVNNVQNNLVNTLLDDFSSSFGYQFFVDFAIRLEQLNDPELLAELLSLTHQFTKVGVSALKPRPLSVNQVFIIENFTIPKPSTKNAIRNLKAFNILLSLWSRAKTDFLQELILETILAIYKEEKANYFILEGQNTLSSFAERLEEKSSAIQLKYYTLLEYVVFELNYVPCKELITVGIILKNRHSSQSTVLCLKSLVRIVKHNATVFRDVYREVGLLDILCSMYSNSIQQLANEPSESEQLVLGDLQELLINVLSGPNSNNCSIFHECAASKHTFSLITQPCANLQAKALRKRAFIIVQQLILSPCGEENLSQLLVILHKDKDSLSSAQEAFSLKLSVLKSLLLVLSENHRIRAIFRKIGGFVSVISVIVHMENCLSGQPYQIDSNRVWNLLRCVFATITTAMRFEPANSRYFAQEICSPSFTDSLRLLGCFEESLFAWKNAARNINDDDDVQYDQLFLFPINDLPPKENLTKAESACILLRFLYEMAIDVLDRSGRFHSDDADSSTNIPLGDQPLIIVYPCIVISMIQLIQFIPSAKLCVYLLEKIRTLFSVERNLQVMCDLGIINELLQGAYADIFNDESHPLNPQIQNIFERLSSQHIQTKDLRSFLRLSNPLNCIPLDEIRPKTHQTDRAIALSRIKSIISMATPRDSLGNFLLDPPFIEFDMSQEGFSCIFIPSIAPISSVTSGPTNLLTGAIVGNSDVPVSVIGGIGTGERMFPSQSGLSFTTWIYIHKTSHYDEHNIGILTLYRANAANKEYTCCQVYINPREKTLTISTQELPIFSNVTAKAGLDSDHNIRLLVPELFEDNWHHIVVILNRTLLKNSTINVYIDGKLKLSQKLHYISSIVGGNFGIANTSPLYINAFIGTPPQYRKHSNLIWKQGPCHLIEEPLHQSFVSYIYMLGPNYIGSFQATNYIPSHLQPQQQQQIAEDRVIFGLNSRATSIMTLSKMRRVYSKFDCKQIAKIIGLSTHENATPIYVLHNSAGHLCGPSRPLGGVLIGNIGARCFVPKQITLTFSDIGGAFPLLGLIANAQNMESLYGSVKAIVCVLRTNSELQLEMERINGYQTLAMLLKRKRSHLNSHILHLLFDLISNLNTRLLHHMSKTIYVNLDANFSHPANYRAFKELLVDSIDIWIQSDLIKTVLEYLNEVIYESSQLIQPNKTRTLNIAHLREMNLLSRLVNICKEQTISDERTMHLILVLAFKLLNQTTRHKDILYFGQFIASLHPPVKEMGKQVDRDDNEYVLTLRNSLLKVVLQLMSRSTPAVNSTMQEELVRVLGFDWFLLFLADSLNLETITIGCVNLMLVLSNSALYLKFRDGIHNGGWLKDVDSFIENKSGIQLLGFNLSTTSGASDSGSNELSTGLSSINAIHKDLLTLPGFQHLNWLLGHHLYKSKVYLIILQAMFGYYRNLTPQTLEQIELFSELTAENLMRTLLSQKNVKNFKQEEIICKDLIVSIFSMLNAIFWSTDTVNRKYLQYPREVMHFVRHLYNNNRDFRFFCQSNFDFLNSLCKVIISNPVTGAETEMTTHEGHQLVLDFILTIFVNVINTAGQNSFSGMNAAASSLFSSQKPITTFENILSSFATCKQAQTKFISLFMDCILNSQECNQTANSSQLAESGSIILNFSNCFANIVLMMSTVVDKLWQNCYVDDKKKILNCLLKILHMNNCSDGKAPQHNFKSLKNLTFQLSEITLLYKSANRCVLYLISRTIESVADRIFIFEVLQLIYSNRQLIIVPKCNNDAEFFICLTHCLLQLIDEESISLSASKGRTTWYVVEAAAKGSTDPDEGALLIASVAKKIWDEIYLSKKQLLEDTLKITLTPANSPFGITSVAPDISQLRDTLYDSTLKYWFNFIDNENQRQRRKPNSLSFDLPNANIITEKFTNMNKFNSLVTKSAGGLVSKIVGGTSGMVGTAISSAVGTTRKEVFRTSSDISNYSTSVWTLMPKKDALYWTAIHTSVIHDFVEYQMKQKRIFDYHLKKYVLNEWLNYEYEFLTREKAIWGPTYGSKRLDKWMLDMTEGPNRMRKKLIRNDQFYLNYPYRPEFDSMDSKLMKFKSPISHDSREYFKRVYSEKYFLLDKDEDNQSFELDIADITASIAEGPLDKVQCNSASSNSAAENKRPANRVLRAKSSSDYDDNEPDVDASDSFDISEYVDVNSELEKQGMSKKEEDDNEMQTILRLLEEGEKICHMFRVARIQGLDSFEGLLLFGKEHFYLVDGFTLLKSREIRDIDSLPPNVYDPIIPSTSPQGAITRPITKKVCSKFAYEDIKEVHKRRYLLQPIALELFSLDGRNSLVVFPRNLRNKVYSRFLSLAVHITDNASDSLMGQKRNANVETGGLLSNFIGETSVTQRWVRGEISNFQYLMNLNTLAGRSYNDLMQYPVFPWILADYCSSELDLNNPHSFRDLSKPMGAQTPERLEQFKKRFSEFDADTNMKGGDDLIQGPYHYGTFYSSAMIVASYLVRIEPFTQHFLRLQGGHFDLADRMFHSVGDAWQSAARHNMADLKELIPEFFYLPEFLVNSNRFDFGAKQNGVKLDDVVLPPWAKDDPREFIRAHRAALECDYVSAHLHEWIDLIFGYKQNGPPAVEATNVFHHLFYEGNADIFNIEDPLSRNATIGFINNFGQAPRQLFKKPHPMKKVFSSTGPIISSLSPILPSVGLNSMLNSSSSGKVFIHFLDYLKPSLHPIKELKGAVGQIILQEKTLLAVEQNKVLIPPTFNRYVAWGFADHSLRIGPYESDRALYVWESELFPPNGEILCSAVPNSRMIITAGTNSVISVWRFKGKMMVLSLVQKLYGHTEAVTCLASSSTYGIIVSGSRDKACILWDLNRLVFIRQLGGGASPIHTSPIAAIAINDLTGDIATCCSTMLYLWTINGDLIASVNTLSVPSPSPLQSVVTCQNSSQILCLAFSTYNEWDSNNVILTGSSDGVVKLWSVQYVQELIEQIEKQDSSSSSSSSCEDVKTSVSLNPSKDDIVRRLSIVSIQNENQNDDSDESPEQEEKVATDTDWDLLSCDNPDNVSISHSKSFNNPEAPPSNSRATSKDHLARSSEKSTNTLTVPTIRSSKSDTSLVDSFIVVNEQQKRPNTEAILKSGHRWVAKLNFASKLTMHTAYERKDNREPAAITCLAISKDHRTIFVGDARGRIFSWSVNENKSLSDHWIKDENCINCSGCSTKFSITERKHHCRSCGLVFCAKCSRFESPILRLKITKPVRVCGNCYQQLQTQSPLSKK